MSASYKVIPLGSEGSIALPDDALDAQLNTDVDRTTVFTEMATQDDFHLLRIIGNLKISGSDKTFFEFTPPARLQVRLTARDLNRAQRRGKPLVLAYWQEDEGRWVRLPYGNPPAIADAGGDNWAYFIIKEIADPPIAWGT